MFSNLMKTLAAASLTFLVSGTASAATEIILSNDIQQKTLKGQTFDLLKQEIEKRLGPKVTVKLYHGGTLFNQKTGIQGLQLGSADIMAPAVAIYSPVAPNIGVLLLPFLLSTPEAINAALKDEVVRKMFVPDLEAKNVTPIGVWMNGPRDFGYKGSGLKLLPEDWKGVKIRVQPAPIFVKSLQAIGANVVAMSWSEVPAAIQQGVIDAAEVPPNVWKASGMYEVVNHIILTDYVYDFYVIGANKRWWKGLPANVREGVQAALDAASKWNWENTAKINDEALEFISKSSTKVHKLTPEQKQAWQKAVMPVWKELGDNAVGAEVMTRLKKIAAEHAK